MSSLRDHLLCFYPPHLRSPLPGCVAMLLPSSAFDNDPTSDGTALRSIGGTSKEAIQFVRGNGGG